MFHIIIVEYYCPSHQYLELRSLRGIAAHHPCLISPERPTPNSKATLAQLARSFSPSHVYSVIPSWSRVCSLSSFTKMEPPLTLGTALNVHQSTWVYQQRVVFLLSYFWGYDLTNFQRAGTLQVTYLPVGGSLPHSFASPCFAPPLSLCPLTKFTVLKAWRELYAYRTIESWYQFIQRRLSRILPLLDKFSLTAEQRNPSANSLYANVQNEHSFSATSSR